jgi:glycosyltransferase involved in cell wall biosynthesis
LWKVQPSTVFSHLFFSNSVMRLLKPIFGYKIYTVEHNTYVKKTKFDTFVDRLFATFSKKIISVSDEVKSFVVNQQKINTDKCIVIPNGIDLAIIEAYKSQITKTACRQSLGIGQAKKVFLSVGRLTPQKNQTLLVEAFASVFEKHPHSELIIAGEGQERQNLEELIHRLNLKEQIKLIGATKEIYAYFRASDFLISTSKIEGMSMAYLEALSFGLPLIVTKTGGTNALLEEGQNGFAIDELTKDSVVAAVEKALVVPYESLTVHALKKAGLFSIKENVRMYESLI